ncbi:MAG: hypothetical protein LBT51_10580, partial [Fusobacteriaceae bacterium]|jgi:hypothetical protein|nr:hypothetical protein [Fusobacteriaceae bacterium]
MKNTYFYTWKEFSTNNDIEIEGVDIAKSPIPPGFFSEYGNDSVSLCSKDKIDKYFDIKNDSDKNKKIIELLYCDNGCHNGDGV